MLRLLARRLTANALTTMAKSYGNVERAAEWLRHAQSVVALTGAGISTESGIPDFRGPQGIWTKNPSAEKLSSIEHYMADPDVRVAAWRNRMDSQVWKAEPNSGHRAIVELERKGKLQMLVTQNIDGLHQQAGTSPAIVVEIHGNMREVVCMNCDERAPMERALARVRAGESDPPCRTCGGILKSATISFGQQLVAEDLQRSQQASLGCDVFLAIGTSLGVYPAALLPEHALQTGARLVIVNAEPTPFDAYAHAVFHEPIGEILPRIVELI